YAAVLQEPKPSVPGTVYVERHRPFRSRARGSNLHFAVVTALCDIVPQHQGRTPDIGLVAVADPGHVCRVPQVDDRVAPFARGTGSTWVVGHDRERLTVE